METCFGDTKPDTPAQKYVLDNFRLLLYESVVTILSVMPCDDSDSEKSKESGSGAKVSERNLREFMEAYREEFDEELSPGEASVMLTQLVQLYRLLMQPLPPDKGER